MQLVLDTNVWIDWLVFDDPAVEPLKSAHRSGQVTIVIDDDCLQELEVVLGYPQFQLTDAKKTSHLAEVSRSTVRHHGARRAGDLLPPPRCSDPNDQKFLNLAMDGAADWLLTRDKALLRLNRRLKALGCRVGSPEEWTTASGHPAALIRPR